MKTQTTAEVLAENESLREQLRAEVTRRGDAPIPVGAAYRNCACGEMRQGWSHSEQTCSGPHGATVVRPDVALKERIVELEEVRKLYRRLQIRAGQLAREREHFKTLAENRRRFELALENVLQEARDTRFALLDKRDAQERAALGDNFCFRVENALEQELATR
jgi:hypothetical protein